MVVERTSRRRLSMGRKQNSTKHRDMGGLFQGLQNICWHLSLFLRFDERTLCCVVSSPLELPQPLTDITPTLTPHLTSAMLLLLHFCSPVIVIVIVIVIEPLYRIH